jgi:hypothetical protein
MFHADVCQNRRCGPPSYPKGRAEREKFGGARSRRILGFMAALLPMGFISAGLAQAPGSIAPVGSEANVNCADRLRVERRDDPQNALKNFRQCGASQNIQTTIENITFWYVTSSDPAKDFRFETAWKNNLAILTGQVVGFKPDRAIEILDSGIVRGLRRGKREDLIERWLASHNPAVLAAAVSAEEKKASASADAPAANTRAPVKAASEKSAVRAARGSTIQHYGARRLSRAQQQQRRYARPDPYSDFDSESTTQLNAAQLGNPYEQTIAPSASHPDAYQVPATVGVLEPQGSRSHVPVARQQVLPQPDTLYQPPFRPAAQQQASYPSIPQQVEKNIRTITGLIEENIRTVQQNIFGPIGP